MKSTHRVLILGLALLNFAGVLPSMAVETVVYALKGNIDGTWPLAGLLESGGALYGTTYKGGTKDYGTVFELTPPANGQTAWTKTTLYSFTGDSNGYDGTYPMAGLAAGSDGAFYGTTNGGGLYGYGTVFKLVPPSSGQSQWSEIVLYSFCVYTGCYDGSYPQSPVIFGSDGALYGTTTEGGGSARPGSGTVFKLIPPANGGSAWSETVIYRFCSVGVSCEDGYRPLAGLTAYQGSFYSTTVYGGTGGWGTVFKLTPPANGGTNWTETVLKNFCEVEFCLDGSAPLAGVIFSQGAIYGTTYGGGTSGGTFNGVYSGGIGMVFKLTPPANGGTNWTMTPIHNFLSGRNGANPAAALVADAQGALYGTTSSGGNEEQRFTPTYGTVFKLTPPPQGEPNWGFTLLHSFQLSAQPVANEGSEPFASMILYQGALYGTTKYGGISGGTNCFVLSPPHFGCGTVFKVSLPTASVGPKRDDSKFPYLWNGLGR